MARALVILMAMVLASVPALGLVDFSVRSCVEIMPSRQLVDFPSFSVSAHPLGLPGNFSVTASLDIRQLISGDITFEVAIQRSTFGGLWWIPIPCIGGVGSCTYQDLCGMLRNAYGSRGCPRQFVQNNVPCMCPTEPGTYHMTNAVFNVRHLLGLWAWLIEGDYRAQFKLTDTATGEMIACEHMRLSIVSTIACNGFWCNFLDI